ncbi:MAG: discoidin domain-containing protein, partial [Verrucomicrobia bacterium]|nr:discoidin domain-containing protein [Verrucomicrobiota bacterium]
NQVGPDGKYIIYPGHPIEEMEYTTGNTTIDIAVIRGLAKALIDAEKILGISGLMTPVWCDLRDKMPPYPVKNGVHLCAERYAGPEFRILPESSAYDALPAWCAFPEGWKGNPDARQYYGMGTQLAPVFPVGEIGLSSAPAVLELARNTYLKTGQTAGTWSPNNICGARLGLRDRVLSNVVTHVRNFQITPQGFMSYIGNRDGLILGQQRGGGYFDRLDKPRYQPYFEVSGVIATAIGYTLFDSLDGIIRVFPALPLAGDARIVMRAIGAFIVTAEMRSGDIAYVTILSEQGSQCRVANPWESGAVRVREAGSRRIVLPAGTGRLLTFPTVKGGVYTVERETKPADAYPVVKVKGVRQTGPRLLPPVMLGMPREGWKRYEGPGPRAIKEAKLRVRQAGLRPPGVTNLAASGAKARVLNPHPATNSPCLHDGLYGNTHSVISAGKEAPWEFCLDLGREETIASVVWSRDRSLEAYGDRMAVDYRIEVSGDAQAWKTVATVMDNKTGAGRRDSFPPVKARHVRMVVLKTNGLPPCLDELEVLAPDPRWKPKTTPPSASVPRVVAGDPAAVKAALANSGALINDFLLIGQDYVGPYPTEVRAGHDGQRLLLLVTCRQPAAAVVPVVCPRDDQAIFKHDHIELFIVPEPAGAVYYQLGFDSAGNRYAAQCVKESNSNDINAFASDLKWDPEWRVDATGGTDAWTAVVSLPIKDLGLTPGRPFGLEIARTRPLRFGDENTAWSPLKQQFHETGNFGSAILQ